MSVENRKQILTKALLLLLKPIVRIALRQSIKVRTLGECLKTVFVKVAVEELERAGELVTISKVSVMTGIQRPEANRLMQSGSEIRSDHDIITRVIGLWQTAKRYQDKKTESPKCLDLQTTFAKLVQEVSSDLNPYTVAFELERLGIAKQSDSQIKLLKSGFDSSPSLEKSYRLLAEDADYLFAAVSENISDKGKLKNLHIKTCFDNISATHEAEIRAWFLKKGAALHAEARDYLGQFDRDITPTERAGVEDDQRIKVVLGNFSYTERVK
jgi:hypothetical protein